MVVESLGNCRVGRLVSLVEVAVSRIVSLAVERARAWLVEVCFDRVVADCMAVVGWRGPLDGFGEGRRHSVVVVLGAADAVRGWREFAPPMLTIYQHE